MKSFKFKKMKLLSLVISVIAVLLLTVMSVSAKEFTYSGTGSVSGGGDIAGDASYSLKVTNGSAPIIAYRFAVYKSDGTVPAGATRVDIYNNSWIKYDGYTSYGSMNAARHQNSKQSWQSENEFNNNYSVTSWGFKTVSSAKVGDGGMPHDPTEMENWLMKIDSDGEYPNTLAVFALCGFDDKKKIQNDFYLVIEPVIQCEVDSKISALTNTELAVCGGMELGYDYEGHGGTTGTFKFISLRVCHFFAQYMRINGSPNLWENAPDLGKPVYNNGVLDRFATKATTFYNVIHKAYSVNLVEAKDVVKQVTVNIYPNGSVYTYGGVKYDKTKCTFTVPAGSQITLPEAKRIYWHNPEWRIYKQGSNDMSKYESAKVGGTITVNENIDIVPYYSEKKVRYNVNGGKAEESATWRSGSDDLIMKNNAVFETKPVVSMKTDYRDSSGYWQWIENKDTTPFKLSSSSTPPLGSCQSRHIEKNVKSTP